MQNGRHDNLMLPRMLLAIAAVTLASLALPIQPAPAANPQLVPLDVAYAGSMGPLMTGGIKTAAAQDLGVDIHGRGQGATALARLIVGGSIHPDVFISITPGPMKQVIKANRARQGVPVARTAMVIAYSPKSRFAALLAKAGKKGAEPWWKVLESPGLRFGRTDPRHDPQGLNIIFVMKLAALYYHQPGLLEKILGPYINPAQIFPEVSVMSRLESGQLDAASAYLTQPASLGLPFVSLPEAINLASAAHAADYQQVSVTIGARTERPKPLVFYAAALDGAAHPQPAAAFVKWLQGPAGQAIFTRYHYDGPGTTPALGISP